MLNLRRRLHTIRIRLQNELLLLNVLTILLIIIITVTPSNVLRIVLGLPFILFFPGYTLIAALFPRRDALGSVERVALSFGLSIAVVPFIGLILNYTPWGFRLYPILVSLTIFIIITSIIAWYRRRRLPEVDRSNIYFNLGLAFWRGQSLADKILPVILIAAILGAVGTLGYVIATPKVGERFTEFYILGMEDKAADYATELRVGEEGTVILGIINQEHETVSYWVEVTIGQIIHSEIGPVTLRHEASWEQEVGFTPVKASDDQRVDFLLYKQKHGQAYRSLHLWINVRGQD